MQVVVIGAGLSGLICGQQLARQGINVTILEKSGGVGGRMATRRLQDTHIDHGAQYISPRNPDFVRFIAKLEGIGLVQPWTDRIYQLTPTGLQPPTPEEIYPRFACPDGMTAIAKHLATDLNVQLKTRVVGASYDIPSAQWQLTTDLGSQIYADAIVCAIPAPQFLAIFAQALGELTDLIEAIAAVKFYPNVTVMAGYSADLQVPPEWQAIRCIDNSILSWIGCNSSKQVPNSGAQTTFVFQSTGAFAEQYLDETNLEPQGRTLLAEVGKLLDPSLGEPLWWQVHRWRYSIPQEVLGAACLATRLPLPLVCAGDWCAGNNIEAAYLSGIAAAIALAKML
jgi:renalase